MNQKKTSLMAIVFLVAASAVASADANFLDSYGKMFGAPNTAINVTAGIFNSSNTSQYLPNYNITASLNTSNSTNTTNSSAPLVLNLTIPPTLYGEYNVSVYDNTTDNQTKNFSLFVTNVSNATFAFTNKFPPYTAGSSFTINITLRHVNGSLMNGYNASRLLVEVFSANANETTGWGIANLTAGTDATGTIQYNITVPSTADGQYALVVDRGAGFLVFLVSSGYSVSVNTQSTSGDTTADFAPTETVSVLAKIRDSNNNPVTTATSVAARITLPNGTVVAVSLTAPNATLFPGFYNGTYTTSSSATGEYGIRVDATVGSYNLQTFGGFSVKPYTASLEQEEDFFRDWGGFKAISPGSQVGFNLFITNLSSGAQAEGYLNANNLSAFNCTQLGSNSTLGFGNITLYYAENDTAFNTSVNTSFANGTDASFRVCKMMFSAPTRSGSYIARIQMRFMNYTANATGFFSVQNFFLKVRPISSFGGDHFFQIFSPGGNVTLDISAFNLTSNSELNGSNISAIIVRKVMPLMFGGGMTTETNVIYWSASSPNSTSPQVIVRLPANTTGPILIEVQAMIGNYSVPSPENATGNAMVLAKYIEGFLSPESAGGGGEQGGGPPAASCSGVTTFSGMVRDININQNAQGVIVNGISELREEFTERELAQYGCVSASSTVSNSTSSGNNLRFNVTFATPNATCPQMSGFYFMIVNVSYQGNIDFLPAGFQCRTLQFFPMITSNGENAWQVSPTAGVNLNVSNVRMSNGTQITQGNISILRLMNFNPTTGPAMYSVAAGANPTAPFVGGMADKNVSPGNFTDGSGQNLTRWPNGFVALMVQTCNAAGSICDSAEGGFQVVSFNAFVEQMGGQGSYWPGQNVAIDILAATNVSSNRSVGTGEIQGTNLTGFTVRVGRPWEGQVVSATLNSVRINSDNWDNSSQTGWNAAENWTINFTVPGNAPTGFGVIMITVNNTYGETVDIFMPFSLTKYQVRIPSEEGVQVFQDNRMFLPPEAVNQTTFNLTWLNATANGNFSSKSGRYCEKPSGLNTTRFGMQQENVQYNGTWKMLLLDNATAGLYDTIVVNDTTITAGRITFTNASNRTIASNTTLQLWNIFDCAFATITSTTAPLQAFNNWGGSHQVNQSFLIPYIVSNMSGRVAGANIGVSAVVLQSQQGHGQGGGQGFEQRLIEGVDYIVVSQAVTNVTGLGWLTINFTRSGSFMVFWNITVGSDSDNAGFDSGTFVEVRNFDTWGQPVPSVSAALRLQNATNGSAGGSPSGNWTAVNYSGTDLNLTIFNITLLDPTVPSWFIGKFNETANGTLVNESGTNAIVSTWYFAWNPVSNAIYLDDDNNFTQVQGALNDSAVGYVDNYTVMRSNLNESICLAAFGCGQNDPQIKAIRSFHNWTNSTFGGAANYSQVAFATETQGGGANNFQPATATANLTGRVCAQTFGKPGRPIENANVSVYIQQWGMNGQVTQNLTLYDPLNNTEVSRMPSSVSGCIAANIKAPNSGSFPSGWPAGGQGGGPGEIRATVYNGTAMESGWVGMVQFFG